MSTSQPPVDRYAYTPSAPVHEATHPYQTFAVRAAELAQRESQVLPPFPSPEQVFSGPGYQAPLPPRNPVANAALYCAAIGCLFFPLSFVAMILGGVGWAQSSSRMGVGRHESLAALAISMIVLAAWGVLYMYFWN